MNESVRSMEKSAFRSFWNDGLLDLMLGLVILAVGLSWWQEVAVMGAIFPAVCVSMWTPLRKRLVEPRMGYVEFSGERELKVRSFRHGLIAFFAGTMMLGAAIYMLWNRERIPEPAVWIAGFPLVLIGIPALFFAFFTQCRRYVFYAAILLLAAVQVVAMGLEPHEGLIASGIVITLCGAYIFFRFLLRYPAAPKDAS
jgi:Ca2+/Na+ antiporter